VVRGPRVVAYYTLAAGSASPDDAPESVTQGLGRYRVPVILLARLAVDEQEKGQGLGAAILKDALRRALSAADVIGARAVLTHAKDDTARRFYERFGFVASPRRALHLFLLMETIRDSLEE
jgi:GNAT superfamily N-acetyltransferase